MIYATPTEYRKGSPLGEVAPEGITILPGLEEATGADFAIVPDTHPTITRLDIKPQAKLFERALPDSILAQRKVGDELLSSIPRLGEILQRMLSSCPRCYLVPIGLYEIFDETVYVNQNPTKWTAASFRGAVGLWQLRGGHIEMPTPTNHEQFIQTLKWMEQNVNTPWESVQVQVPNAPNAKERTLMTCPGIGQKMAHDLLAYTGDSLWAALSVLTNLEYANATEKRFPGIGKVTVQKNREHFSITPDAYGLGMYLTK